MQTDALSREVWPPFANKLRHSPRKIKGSLFDSINVIFRGERHVIVAVNVGGEERIHSIQHEYPETFITGRDVVNHEISISISIRLRVIPAETESKSGPSSELSPQFLIRSQRFGPGPGPGPRPRPDLTKSTIAIKQCTIHELAAPQSHSRRQENKGFK